MALFAWEVAEFTSDCVIINNSAACEVTFTRRPDGHIHRVLTDDRNPVNRNTIARWTEFVTAHFAAAYPETKRIAA